jgi:hypothetical protein
LSQSNQPGDDVVIAVNLHKVIAAKAQAEEAN